MAPEEIRFSFEGREVRCRSGVSLAAALAAAGELELRQTAAGDGRGVFCGMGVCQECRVTVDGRSGVRACMISARDSLRVARDEGVLTVAHGDNSADTRGYSGESGNSGDGDHHRKDNGRSSGRGDAEALTPDILIIGAGPAGLTAAATAAESGAEVVVIDERASGGGQYYKQPSSAGNIPDSLARDGQFAAGRALIERTMRSGASVLTGTQVWGAFAPHEFAVFDGHCSKVYRPKRTIVATGAHERGLPVPGWTRPGVMTTGAAQTMLRSYGTLPGRRILVAGNGPFNMQVALELSRAGAEVVAVAELAAGPGAASMVSALRMGLSAAGLTWNGIGYLRGLSKAGVPVLYRRVLTAVEQGSTGLVARTGRLPDDGIDSDLDHEVDVVCMGYGFQPNNEVLRSLGCRHRYDEHRGHLVTDRGSDCETSVAGVYGIGDCCGFSGAASALQEGVIAATAAIRSLQLPISNRQEKDLKRALRTLRRHRSFQSALWHLFAAPRFHTELAGPDTVVCRCENVTLRELENAIAEDGQSIGTVKRRTRLGMGPCQGRYCAPIAAHLVAGRNGRPIDEFSYFAPRSPLKPVRIGDMLATTRD